MPFTNVPWESPESALAAAEFCAVCLIDLNKSGADKIKANCKLPIRSTPGGPFNRNALRNAAARIFQMVDVPPDEKRKAASRLVGLMKEAKIVVGSDALLRLAGKR